MCRTYCILDMSLLSFRSAPAQKHSSIALASISTRVPCPIASPLAASSSASVFTASISLESSARSCRDKALRLWGLLRDRTRMWPTCGAGMLWVLIKDGAGAVERRRIESRAWRLSRVKKSWEWKSVVSVFSRGGCMVERERRRVRGRCFRGCRPLYKNAMAFLKHFFQISS